MLLRNRILAAMGAAALAGAATGVIAAEPVRSVIVVSSYDAPPYRDALGGVNRVITAAGRNGVIQEISLGKGEEVARQALAARAKDAVIVALGAKATRLIQGNREASARFACMTMDAGGLPGVVLQMSPEVHLNWMRMLMPRARAVGLLHAGATERSYLERFEAQLQRIDSHLYPVHVAEEGGLTDALQRLTNTIDVLIGVHDPSLFSPQTAVQVLQFSFRSGVPMIGMSDAWAKAGALFALDWDYGDIGQQCGELALGALRGDAVIQGAALMPRKVDYSVNLKTANYFRLTIPAAILKGARRVYD